MKYYERFIYIFIVSDTSHNFKQGAAFKLKKSKAFYLFTHHVLDTIYYTKSTIHLNLYT
jgi:hypothetical protein